MKPLLIVSLIVLFAFNTIPTLAQKNINTLQGNEGKRWALCIGINDYKDKRITDLTGSEKDARNIGKILKEYGQFDSVHIMTDSVGPNDPGYPSKANVQQKMTELGKIIQPGDMVVFFFSGHGIKASGEGFLVMAASYKEKLNATSLKVKDILAWLKGMKVRKSMLLLDAAQKQFFTDKQVPWNGVLVENLTPDETGAVFYAAAPGSTGHETAPGQGGVFATCLMDGLKGLADSPNNGGNNDKLVTFNELANYVKKNIGAWATKTGKKQSPQLQITSNEFANLALSTYSNTPKSILSSAAKKGGGKTATLRTEFNKLTSTSVLMMLKKQGFFDSKLNPTRTFQNSFNPQTLAGDKVVSDAATGLMWHASGSPVGMELEKAKFWLDSLNKNGYAGFNDWRLPTLEEATSLINPVKTAGLYIDPAFSPQQKNIWTGDTASKETAWVILFDMGRVNRDYFFNYFFIRPVRTAK